MDNGLFKAMFLVLILGLFLSMPGATEVSARYVGADEPMLPNLVPAAPEGWEQPLLASNSRNTLTSDTLTAFLDTYLDWAIQNVGADITTPFKTCIYYDGLDLQCWISEGLKKDDFVLQTDWKMLIPTQEGNYHVEIRVDVDNAIFESNETDNSIGFDFNWQANESLDLNGEEPLVNDVMLAAMPAEIQALATTHAPAGIDVSTYMIDSVVVSIIFVESDGSAENWTFSRQQAVRNEIESGLNQWRLWANQRGVSLTFLYDVKYSVPTSYEPIQVHCQPDYCWEDLWISDVMRNLGYFQSGYYTQVVTYNNDLRRQRGTKWATTIFVLDSLKAGPNAGRAHVPYLGGPFIYLPSSGGGGEARIVAHEMGHIFFAADQYYQSTDGTGCQNTTARFGYLGIPNSNCMRNNFFADTNNIMNNTSWNLHWTTAQQLGWRDEDSDGLMDPIDTSPSVEISLSPMPNASSPMSYAGVAYDNPYPSYHCTLLENELLSDQCPNNDVNINEIWSVEYQIDSGLWNSATATDGSFNSDYENFTFSTPILLPGSHFVLIKATNSVGAESYWSEWITIPNPPPATPPLVQASNGNYVDKINLTWSGVSGATSYEIWRNSTNASSGAVKLATVSVSPYADTGASPGALYYYWVKACNGNGCSSLSASNPGYRGQNNVIVVNPPELTPIYSGDMCGSSWHMLPGYQGYNDAPAYITLNTNQAAYSTNSAIWQPNLPTAGTYKVEAFVVLHDPIDWLCPTKHISWDTSDAKYTLYHAAGTTTISGNLAPLNNQWLNLGNFVFNAGTSGKVKLVDLNSEAHLSRTISFSAVRFTLISAQTMPGAFFKSSPLNGATNQPGSTTLAWDNSSGATSYSYCYYPAGGSCSNWISTGAATTVTLSGLQPGVTYSWQVKAENSSGAAYADGSSGAAWSFLTSISGDEPGTALVLAGIPSIAQTNTATMTKSVNDPNLMQCNRVAGNASIWYKYTPVSNGTLNLDTFGSGYDTQLGVFRGSPGSLIEVSCNDDASGTQQSASTTQVTGGTTYYIVVSEYTGFIAEASAAERKPVPEIEVQSGGILKLNVTTFADARSNHKYWRYIEGFYSRGITVGCSQNPLSYCADNSVTRAAMAVFMLKTKNGNTYLPPASTGIFTDVPFLGKEWMQPYVEDWYNQGITVGCSQSPRMYCPENTITRAAISVFILKLKYGNNYVPPTSTGIFTDVPYPGKEWMQPYVEDAYKKGFTEACNASPLQFCPEAAVTRGDMAAFLSKAFNIAQKP